MFNLFDESSQGFLVQDDWISHLKNTCAPGDESEDESRRDQEKLDLVELLEAVTYLVCQENHVVPDTFYKVLASSFILLLQSVTHSSLYPQIWSSRGVGTKLMRCIDRDEDDVTTVEEIMSFVIVITNPL